MVAALWWWRGRGSGGMRVVGCGVGGLWVLWHGFLLGCRLVWWLWRGGGVVVGCGLWAGDRRRRCGRGLGSASSAWWCVAGKSGLSLLSLSDSLSSLFSLPLTPILSLKLGFSFGLIFCYGYRCISRFMVVAGGGCCGGGGDGFIVGLRRWPRIWVAICQSLGRI